MLEQLSLILPGCQPWYKEHLIATHISKSEPNKLSIAYCSTLTIVRFDFEDIDASNATTGAKNGRQPSTSNGGPQVKYSALATPFESNITSIAWHPTNRDCWVVATTDRTLNFLEWTSNVKGSDGTFGQIEVKHSIKTKHSSPWIDFCADYPSMLAYVDDKNTVKVVQVQSTALSDPIVPAFSVIHDTDIKCVRWLFKKNPKLLVGDELGGVCLYELDISHNPLKPKISKKKFPSILELAKNTSEAEDGSGHSKQYGLVVADIRVDHLSEDYVIIAYSNGVIVSFDLMSEKPINSYHQKSHSKINGIDWVPAIPGGFVSADGHSSMLKLWAISQKAPIETIKLLSSPIHAISTIVPSRLPQTSALDVAKECLFLSFDDGSTGIYNVVKKNWLYLRQGSHTETIFYCDTYRYPNVTRLVNQDTLKLSSIPNFSVPSTEIDPYEPIIVATSSYDGTVKTWDVGMSTYRGASLPDSKGGSVNPRKSALNGASEIRNIGMISNPSVEFTLLDSYPPLGAGYKKEDSPSMETKYGIIYSVSWSSDGSMRWVAGSSRGKLIVYNAKQGRLIAEYGNIHTSSIIRVAWNPHTDRSVCATANMVASCGADGTCVVWRPEDGSIYIKYKMNEEFFGCAWSPLKAGFLSAGLLYGRIAIWDTTEMKEAPLALINAHDMRVFNTCWSPLMPCFLASASDDNDVRIWKVDTKKCVTMLKGHKKKARSIAWHDEITNIIITGAWDAQIRIWNALSGECLIKINEHAADVYALSSLPSHPFLFISVSRDNTVRLWSMKSMMSNLLPKLLESLTKNDATSAISTLTGPIGNVEKFEDCKLAGPLTQKTITIIKSNAPLPEKVASIMKMFSVLNGDDVLRRAILYLQKSYKPKFCYHDGFSSILPPELVVRYFEIKIQGLESASLIQKLQSSEINAPPMTSLLDERPSAAVVSMAIKNEMVNLLEAAKSKLQLNDIQSYCDYLCLLGHWDRALALAPAVSLNYWKDLLGRYTRFIKNAIDESDSPNKTAIDLILPYVLAEGDWNSAVHSLLRINDENGAYVLASSAEGTTSAEEESANERLPQPGVIGVSPTIASTTTIKSFGGLLTRVISNIVTNLSESYSEKDPFATKVAAAWNLTIGDVDKAKSLLVEADLQTDAAFLDLLRL